MPYLLITMAGVVILSTLFVLALIRVDKGRIKDHIERRGGLLIHARLRIFGPGWFGEKNARIYEVLYTDENGDKHKAYCKTSMLAGVYFTEDRIVRYAERPATETDTTQSLAEENQRLREELERLRRAQGRQRGDL